MRALVLGFFAVMWLFRTADPLVHSLLHDHHEHCAEQGVHLHEADELCAWSDPATLWAAPPTAWVWSWVTVELPRHQPTPYTSVEFHLVWNQVPARGPPCLA